MSRASRVANSSSLSVLAATLLYSSGTVLLLAVAVLASLPALGTRFGSSSSARLTNSSMAATRFFISFMLVRFGFKCLGLLGRLPNSPSALPSKLVVPAVPLIDEPPLGLSKSRALERDRDLARLPRMSLAFGSSVCDSEEVGKSLSFVYWLRPTRLVPFTAVRPFLRCDERGTGVSAAGGVETVDGGGG